MASIKKRGDSYTITVSAGYDIKGRQLRKYKTYTPEKNMTKKQIDKELNRIAVLFEEQVQQGVAVNGSITFADFAETWINEFAVNQLKASTFSDYKERLNDRILPAIGNIKLCKLQPHHLISFYDSILKSGEKRNQLYKAKPVFIDTIKKRGIKYTELSKDSGVAIVTIRNIKNGKLVYKKPQIKSVNI